MPLQPFEATKKLCEASGWSITNLELQKLLFLAQKDYFEEHDGKLISVFFEAWDYGPVVPEIYRAARRFGAESIPQNFLSGVHYAARSLDERLRESYCRYRHMTPGQLVALTHKAAGAWDRNYQPGTMGIAIPDRDIIAEARRLAA